MVLRRIGDVQGLAALYKIPAGAHPHVPLLSVAASVLTSAPSGRLYKALVETKKAAGVGGGPSFLREPGMMTFSASVRKDSSVEEARTIMTGILDGLAARPFTKEEVDRAQAELLKSIELSLTQSDQIGLQLSTWAAAGDWRLLYLYRDRIRQATPEDVQRAALAYLKPSNRTIGMFLPEDKPDRAEIPATPDIHAMVKDYKGGAVLSQGEAFDPSPENVEKRITRVTLPNGMKLLMLPKKNRGGTVTAMMRLGFGDTASLKGRSTAASAAAQMLMRGSAKRSRQQIQDELNRLKVQMNVGGGAGSANINIQTVAASLPDALRLAAEVLREPAFPPAEFDQLRNSVLASYENARQSPETLAQLNLVRHMNPYPEDDVRYVRTPDELIAEIKKTTVEDAKRFYQDFFGASNAEMTVVGDFDPAAIQKLATELFGNWKSPSKYARISRDYSKIAPANRNIETPEKANAMFCAGMPLNVGESHADFPALLLANYMMGGHSTSRLYSRIRAKEGLSYATNSAFQSDAKDPRSDWIMFAITNPVNIAKVEAAFRDEMQRALKDGFTADEVAAAQKAWLQSRRVGWSQDSSLAGRLMLHEREGRTMAFDAELEKKVAALTAGQVSAAWRKHLDLSQVSIVRAGDLQKAAATAK